MSPSKQAGPNDRRSNEYFYCHPQNHKQTPENAILGGIPEIDPDAVEKLRVGRPQILGQELKLGRGVAVALLVPDEGQLCLPGCSLHRDLLSRGDSIQAVSTRKHGADCWRGGERVTRWPRGGEGGSVCSKQPAFCHPVALGRPFYCRYRKLPRCGASHFKPDDRERKDVQQKMT